MENIAGQQSEARGPTGAGLGSFNVSTSDLFSVLPGSLVDLSKEELRERLQEASEVRP